MKLLSLLYQSTSKEIPDEMDIAIVTDLDHESKISDAPKPKFKGYYKRVSSKQTKKVQPCWSEHSVASLNRRGNCIMIESKINTLFSGIQTLSCNRA